MKENASLLLETPFILLFFFYILFKNIFGCAGSSLLPGLLQAEATF